MTSFAVVPSTINYQGRLTDDGGNPIDTTVDMTFSICTDSTGGLCIWGETQEDVVVTDGLFNIKLGSDSALTDKVFDGNNRWLHVKVGIQSIEPSIELITTPYAFRVSTIDGATGGNISGDIKVDGHVGIGTESSDSCVLFINRKSTDIGGVVCIIDSSLGSSIYVEKIDDGPGIWVSNKGNEGIGIYNEIDAGVGLYLIQKASAPALDIREDTTSGAGILLRVNSDGKVGIGNQPSEKLEVSGIIYSNTGGFRFPDGSVQTTAYTGSKDAIIKDLLVRIEKLEKRLKYLENN